MGKKLTEEQKVERAAKRQETKAKKELGPLFEDQAEPVDRDELRATRRMGLSRNVEHVSELLGAMDVLDSLHEGRLRDLARRHVDEELFGRLLAYRTRTYPPTAVYGIGFWKKVLAGERIVLAW